MYTLKPSKFGLVPDTFGYHIEISRVGLYRDNKWVKWVKLTDLVVQALIRSERTLTDETAQKIIKGENR